VSTPCATLAARTSLDFPSYLELEAIDGISRWPDAQSRRPVRLPFIGVVQAGAGLRSKTPAPLHLMHKHHLVRHTSPCEWALFPTRKERPLVLWRGWNARSARWRLPNPLLLIRMWWLLGSTPGISTA